MSYKISDEAMARNAHIPDSEVLQDIRDTEAEIAQMERELPGLRLSAEAGDRWADMRAKARETGIVERRAFIEKLTVLMAAREKERRDG